MIPLYDNVRARRFPFFTAALIALNAAMFAGWQMRVGLRASVFEGGLVPAELTGPFPIDRWLPLFTYMFLHGGWMHLLGNMWFLWIFGVHVEEDMGSGRFLAFYLICGVAAALCHFYFSRRSLVPLVGASGAISGVLGAYLILYPRARIMTLAPLLVFVRIFAVPAWVFLLVWIGLQGFARAMTPAGQAAGVAYLAHLGGFASGLGLIFFFRGERRPRYSGDD
jgi:membrane associated rhomboid family serine protease